MNSARHYLFGSLFAVAAALATPAILAPVPAAAQEKAADAGQFVQQLGDKAIAQLAGQQVPEDEERARFKNLLIMLVVLPLFVGNAVRAAGWMTIFGSKGFLNVTMMQLGLIHEPLEIMYTESAVVAGIIAVNLPYMVLTLQSVIEGINRNVEEAAFSLGAGPATMFRRVLLPLSLPGILAGTILTFILSMNAYATPVLLGGPKFRMMGPLIYGQFQLNNWPFGAAAAFILMAATLGLTATANILVQRRFRR